MPPSSDSSTPHIVMLPLPETGHINPLMHLATYLSRIHGFLITFVNTEYNHRRILEANPGRLPSDHGLDIRLVSIPDGLTKHENRDTDIPIFLKVVESIGPALEKLISELKLEESMPPVSCIISDVLAVSTVDVAVKLGIPRVAFWPTNASIHACICHAIQGASSGTFPLHGGPEPDDMVSFPGIPKVPGGKLPWVVGSKEDVASIFQSNIRNTEVLKKSEWILCNSVYELEVTAHEMIPLGFPKVCPIGPILPAALFEGNVPPDNSSRRITTSLWPEHDACLAWLDAQELHSVMYVSLGSIAILNKEQLHELAYGLEASGVLVLWVLRADLAGEDGSNLPEGYMERIEGRIKIVEWCPQLLVLSHKSVGGFLTHCGWNSVLEAMSMGVPMLAWPQLVDQFMNAELVVGQWGVGVRVENGAAEQGSHIMGRAHFEALVKRLMSPLEGHGLREKAWEIRGVILHAARAGSSHTALRKFVDWVIERQNGASSHANQSL